MTVSVVSTVGQACEKRIAHPKSETQGIVNGSCEEGTAQGTAVPQGKRQQMKQSSELCLWKVVDVTVLPCHNRQLRHANS